ncbi:hypothetical protein BpHYR1_017675 [Brachionus plicatilis]|uniref:Secreted protein n=1 Tax=Brachionus plicatilis TaxID=10195 RepID=A0A3M7QRA4_BRAPC|nr:hypothetical protein BpHYR1_017675 [Brachionus plicatilis]
MFIRFRLKLIDLVTLFLATNQKVCSNVPLSVKFWYNFDYAKCSNIFAFDERIVDIVDVFTPYSLESVVISQARYTFFFLSKFICHFFHSFCIALNRFQSFSFYGVSLYGGTTVDLQNLSDIYYV